MIHPKKIYSYLWTSVWFGFAASVFLLAVLFGMARLLLPYASEYKTDISETLSEYLGQPVKISSLDTEWHGLGPALVLEDIELLSPETNKPVLQFGKARFGINIFSSLFQMKPVMSGVTLVGVDLTLTREKTGRFVVGGIKGEGMPGDDSGGLDVLTSWAFSQDELGLERSNITWRDKMAGNRKMYFSAVNVRLQNSGDNHVFDASVLLPKRFGKSLTLHVDMNGDLLDPDKRKTRAYFRGEAVKFASFLETQSIAGVGADVGEADFQIWSRWENGVLQKIQGEVDVGGVELFPSSQQDVGGEKKDLDEVALELQQLAGKFRWTRKDYGWQFNARDVVMLRNHSFWEPSQINLIVKNDVKGINSIDAYASRVQLEDAAQLLLMFSVGDEILRTPLQAIKPQGKANDVRLVWNRGDEFSYKAYASLHQAAINGWKFVPAVKNLSGELWLDEKGGKADLQNSAMVLDFPNLFRWPLDVNELSGQIGWTMNDNGWALKGREIIANNEDVDSRIALDIVKENADISPFMSLVAKFTDGNGSHVAHYLPTGIMSNRVVDWLDNAIVDGRVASGGTLIHGRMSKFPFVDGNGKFEVRFGVENGRLNYAEDWPPISNIDANVQFLGKGLSVKARQGKILSNNIRWANVTLPDLKSLPLRASIKGEILGKTQDKLNYLVESPQLNKAFGRHLEGMKADGESLLHLGLDLHIGDYKNTSLQGWVDLTENSLSIPALGNVLSDVKGKLNFYRDGIEADNLQAKLFGQTTDLKISTDEKNAESKVIGDLKSSDIIEVEKPNNRWINILAKGNFDASNVASSYLPPIKDLLKGEGQWDAQFNIPVSGGDDASNVANLQAIASLEGVEVGLPSPFKKPGDDLAEVKLQVNFPRDRPPLMEVSYAGLFEGLFELSKQSDGSDFSGIKRGELRLSGGEVSLPDEKGLRIVGSLDEVSLDDWLGLLPVNDASQVNQKTTPSSLNSTDIAIRSLTAYGQKLHKVRIKSLPVENSWAFDVSSNELSGQFEIPSNIISKPVKADLKFLYLVEPELTAGSVNPRDIPALDFQVKDLRYESRRFGELKLETTRVANGLRIEQLILKPKATTITSNGGWYAGNGREDTNINVQINTTNVGHTLKELGYVGTISEGQGEVRLDLQWPSALFDVDVNQVQGSMDMFLRDGQLLDIDPGAGRLFGMLSLQALPRRLFMDFSDVFSKGFGFSTIKGNFTIEDGDAYTNNLYLDGPAARVDISGRAGLADQDYDQQVIVIPKVAESLPLLGVLAATPQIGAAILFMQKLFKKDIDEVTKNQYTITGGWSDPVIKKVKPSATVKQPVVDLFDDE